MTHVDVNLLTLDRDELIARMMCTDVDTVLSWSAKCEEEVRSAADCFYTLNKTCVQVNGDSVSFAFGECKSVALARFLENCDSAYIVAVSLGHGVDRLLRQKAVVSTIEQFVTDAVASTYAESLCDYVQSILPSKTTRRFSPGYGDLPLSFQTPLLQFLDHSGISLTESGLMIPSKSVTFIAGVKK